MSADPGALAAAYFDAWLARDFETLRSLLADDVSFRGPLATIEGADDCVAGLRGMSQIMTDIVVHKRWVDGQDVITWFDLHTTVAPTAPTAKLEPHGRRQDRAHPCHLRRARTRAARSLARDSAPRRRAPAARRKRISCGTTRRPRQGHCWPLHLSEHCPNRPARNAVPEPAGSRGDARKRRARVPHPRPGCERAESGHHVSDVAPRR